MVCGRWAPGVAHTLVVSSQHLWLPSLRPQEGSESGQLSARGVEPTQTPTAALHPTPLLTVYPHRLVNPRWELLMYCPCHTLTPIVYPQSRLRQCGITKVRQMPLFSLNMYNYWPPIGPQSLSEPDTGWSLEPKADWQRTPGKTTAPPTLTSLRQKKKCGDLSEIYGTILGRHRYEKATSQKTEPDAVFERFPLVSNITCKHCKLLYL